MNKNLEIAQSITLRPIGEIAAKLDIALDDVELYGRYKAKLPLSTLERMERAGRAAGKLILVSAITPTPAGEGKTTVTIGLSQAMNRAGRRTISATREPAMGPVFGVKGGAAGGGRSQVLPMEDINLHFTGDMHAITAAHNLLAAILDNSLHQGNPMRLDLRTVSWERVIDMNDRALRDVVIGLGGKNNGFPRETGFEITPASEVMAILCLSQSLAELKKRLGCIVVGMDMDGAPVTAADLKAAGAMAAVLKDALKPNLVQTVEGCPAIIHGGPFGNIAHGCSSLIATKMGLRLADYVITEAGFGSDLGAEKFCDVVCRVGDVSPDAIVLVATIRALKMHGGMQKHALEVPNPAAVHHGLGNLDRHYQHLLNYGVPVIVAINRFASDCDEEVTVVLDHCREIGARASDCDVWGAGGAGAGELADLVTSAASEPSEFKMLYDSEMSLRDKINAVATKCYGAASVELTDEAAKREKWLAKYGFDTLPLCVAKTQYSLSDDPTLLNSPTGFKIKVRDFKACTGAGFVVVYSGSILTMPGLPRVPASDAIDVDNNGEISGLF